MLDGGLARCAGVAGPVGMSRSKPTCVRKPGLEICSRVDAPAGSHVAKVKWVFSRPEKQQPHISLLLLLRNRQQGKPLAQVRALEVKHFHLRNEIAEAAASAQLSRTVKSKTLRSTKWWTSEPLILQRFQSSEIKKSRHTLHFSTPLWNIDVSLYAVDASRADLCQAATAFEEEDQICGSMLCAG
ncbi:hypothetical protein EYF80_006577 [Liparis tanakae]|uniref:Uncharacterized protein n=1 Tax=Liparis tanakae TaxID=230148 RepID=A0A4Z2J092_9TELE|nr:hypothetical protein EYF80_006577 [Liparis tanakae]